MILPLFATPKLLPRYAHIPYTPLAAEQQHQQRPNPSPRQRFFRKLGGYKISAVVLLAVAVIITTAVCLLRDPKLEHLRQPGAPVPVIPKDFRVVGLVFYGRRSRVEILDCYLKVRTSNQLRFPHARSRLIDGVRSKISRAMEAFWMKSSSSLARTMPTTSPSWTAWCARRRGTARMISGARMAAARAG